MNNAFFQRAALWLAMASALWIFPRPAFAQYSNGIYAEFTTSMGSYTCRLEYTQSPKAVANFIGLATGQRPWLNLPNGQVRTNPFYNGTTIHRVVANFIIQGGSPNKQGTDGPGYQFVDEFTPSLRHDAFGVLSMANSGPDSNGSQYFLTIGPQPGLNDVHAVFGKLFGGSNVIYAISRVAVNGNSQPLTNVVVQNVVIRRIGTNAQAFDINAQGLPLVTNLNLKIARAGPAVSLTFSNRLNADNSLYLSPNLLGPWSASSLGIEVASPVTNTIYGSSTAPSQFFHMVQAQYPPTLFVPKNVRGRILTLNFSAGNGTFVVTFDNAGGGSYTWTGGAAGPIYYYNWKQDPYRGRFLPLYLLGFPYVFELHLDYDTASSGTFKGKADDGVNPTILVSGTFTSSP